MSDRKRIYLCLAHMSEDGMEQKYVKEAFDTNWVKANRKALNAGKMKVERMEKFEKLLALCERYKRKNQYI